MTIRDKYKCFEIHAERLTTWLVLGGISISAIMGDPIEAALMRRFISRWELGWAIHRHNGAAGVHIGDQRSLISSDRCAEPCESHLHGA
jgi:hypothetical protein